MYKILTAVIVPVKETSCLKWNT